MKKPCIIFCVFLILISSIGFSLAEKDNGYDTVDYLRIHIRANSNLEDDQTVKYQIKDVVVEFLAPKLAGITDKASAVLTVENNLKAISFICEKTLKQKGFNYGASASIEKEKFPTRSYDDVILSEGEYDAVIITLGDGLGDNWWCVVYPPLCFTDCEEVVYKSKILELIDRFKIKEK